MLTLFRRTYRWISQTWNDLGRAGREYAASGPTAADLETFFGGWTADEVRRLKALCAP